jgi:hypothetical protein
MVKLKSSLNKNVTTARVTSGKLKSSLSKNVTTVRVTSGKVEFIIKQKRYYSKGY